MRADSHGFPVFPNEQKICERAVEATRHLKPHAHEWDEATVPTDELHFTMRDSGLAHVMAPDSLGHRPHCLGCQAGSAEGHLDDVAGEARPMRMYEGANEVLRLTIARDLPGEYLS